MSCKIKKLPSQLQAAGGAVQAEASVQRSGHFTDWEFLGSLTG